MAAWFDSLVDLCRMAQTSRVESYTLHLDVTSSRQARSALDQIDRGYEITSGGVIKLDPEEILDGEVMSLSFSEMSGNDNIVLQSLQSMLSFQGGQFLAEPPKKYYLIDENYAAGEKTSDPSLIGYLEVPSLFSLLCDVSDLVRDSELPREFLIFSKQRVEIPFVYGINDLPTMPSRERLDALRILLGAAPHASEKRDLFKALLVRMLERVPPSERLSWIINSFENLEKSFKADYECFVTDFNFDKQRAAFEHRRTDYLLKMNSESDNLLTKILAIPIGQALVVSQYKGELEHALGNLALFAGSALFSLLAALLISNHRHSLRHLRSEVDDEIKELDRMFPGKGEEVKKKFGPIIKRIHFQSSIIPNIVMALVFLGFVFSLVGFLIVPPATDIARSTSSILLWLGHLLSSQIRVGPL
jgi:hypothetical protein